MTTRRTRWGRWLPSTSRDRLSGGLLPSFTMGQGRPVVYLPGLSPTHGSPDGLARLLEVAMVRRLATRHEVHWVGLRTGVPSGYRMGDFARDCAEALGGRFTGPVPVVGFSTGGLLGLQLAIDHPDVVDRLVAVGAGHRLSDEGRAADLRWARALDEGRPSEAWRGMASDVVTGDRLRGALGAVLAALGPRLGADACRDGIRTAEAEVDFDAEGSLHRIAAPTLLVVGDRDPNCGIDLVTRTCAGIPDASLRVLPAVGHLGTMVNRRGSGQILEFLDR